LENNELEKENFDEEAEIRRIVRSISLAEKYFLFFASCNQVPKQKELIKEIKSRLKGKKIVVIELKEPIKSLLSEIRQRTKAKKSDAVIVTGLRNSIPSAKPGKDTSFISNLNISRDTFAEILQCPLILFLPEYALTEVMNGAPDFFSVRSGVFFFENDENIMSRQISQAISTGNQEHDALLVEERQQRIENLKELLKEYQSLPENKRDFETEFQLKDKLAGIYYITANFSEAERLRNELLNKARQKNDEEISRQLNELALVYNSQGKYEEAIELYKQALLIDEKTIGKEHPEYATHLNNLAGAYLSQGKYEEAIELYKQALLISEKTIGKEHPSYATRLNNLSMVYSSQSKYEEAIELFKQALLIDEKTIGKEHPSYATRLNNLALVYNSQGKYEEAIELYKQALLIDEKTIGKEHPEYATRLNNLALVYKSQSKYEEAIELFKQAKDITEKTIGNEHPAYAIRLNNLAGVYRYQGKFREALDLFLEAKRILKKTLPENHPYIASVKISIEICRAKLGGE